MGRGRLHGGGVRVAVALCLLLVSGAALAEPPTGAVRPTLEPRAQALGWWMTGAGTVGLLAGGFALGVAQMGDGRTRDLQMGVGSSMLTLGGAFLAAGVYLLAFDIPGPCETSGTGLEGPATRPGSQPASRPAARLFFGPGGVGLRARF